MYSPFVCVVQEFALEVDGAKKLRILCYDFTRGLDDEMYDKGAISLVKQEICGPSGQDCTVKMDQVTVTALQAPFDKKKYY